MAKQSKKEAERLKAEEHKKQLAEAKARRRAGGAIAGPEPTLKENPTLLIYCEGKNTEPSYFNKFKRSSVNVKAFGDGKNTVSLVKAAKKIAKKAADKGKPYEKVWCVFDADPKPDNPNQLKNFNDAVVLAEKYGFGCAYSNQAFEYWLILHFEDHQGGSMARTDYDSKLNGYLNPLGLFYEGRDSKMVTQDVFDLMFEEIGKDRQGNPITRYRKAVERARRNFDNIGDHSNPGKEESSTVVYKLVEELLGYV